MTSVILKALFSCRIENPVCLVKEDGEEHLMIPDDIEDKTQVQINIVFQLCFHSFIFTEMLPR